MIPGTLIPKIESSPLVDKHSAFDEAATDVLVEGPNLEPEELKVEAPKVEIDANIEVAAAGEAELNVEGVEDFPAEDFPAPSETAHLEVEHDETGLFNPPARHVSLGSTDESHPGE